MTHLECMVCDRRLRQSEALLVGADIRLLGRSPIYDAVAKACFAQLDYALPCCADIQESLKELRTSLIGAEYRRQMLLRTPPAQDVYLIAHKLCIPKDAELDPKISVPWLDLHIEALAWDDAIKESRRYNEKGWRQTVQKLFGREFI